MSALARREKIENIWLQRPIIVSAITGALCVAAATQLPRLRFDYNLLHMQSEGLPAVVFEQKLIDSGGKSVLFGAVMANSVDDALALEKKLRALTNTVSDVESVVDYMTQDAAAKLKLIGEVKQVLAPLNFAPPDMQPVNITNLSTTLYSTYGYLGNAVEDPDVQRNGDLSKQLAALRNSIENLRKDMLAGNSIERAAHANKLAQFHVAFLNDIHSTFDILKNQDDSGPLRPDDLPPALRNRFIGVNGKILLMVDPKKDLNERANQKEFLDDVRQIVPHITGTPVQLYEYTDLLKNSYIQAAWYSLIAITLMVFFHFRSPIAVLLALIPVGIGTLWLIGLMGMVGAEFNPANIMTLPLVIGIGVTNGVNILNRYAEEGTPSILTRSTGKAVLVSGLTAIAGFGSLILAKHRGIHSLGCIMAVGIATCMIAGLTFLPALLNLIGKHYSLIKQPSASKTPTPGQEEPR
jgi:predicted RND superfamily exporter protein